MKIYIHSLAISVTHKEDPNKGLAVEYSKKLNRQFPLQSATALLLTHRENANYMVHLSFLGIRAIS
jgi:hypothetical protein